MLIKSECQALDKTRHKPAWNLFEQCASCEMAGEICNVACPLNWARSPVSITSITLYNNSGETDRQTDRQTWWNPPGPPPVHSGGDAGCKQESTMPLPLAPTWMMPPSNLFDNHTAEGETHARTCRPVIMENKGSLSALTV